ncbi:hypothetical protein B0H19DRAFT_1352349 [Mycena capillaripes]|nr:hypothetical protein B0H19DRAFT_1352349 [Mycena capillaripes]
MLPQTVDVQPPTKRVPVGDTSRRTNEREMTSWTQSVLPRRKIEVRQVSEDSNEPTTDYRWEEAAEAACILRAILRDRTTSVSTPKAITAGPSFGLMARVERREGVGWNVILVNRFGSGVISPADVSWLYKSLSNTTSTRIGSGGYGKSRSNVRREVGEINKGSDTGENGTASAMYWTEVVKFHGDPDADLYNKAMKMKTMKRHQ